VAGEQDVVAWLDHPCETHEKAAVDTHGCRTTRTHRQTQGRLGT
jgi:hypothetical protein